MTWLTLQHSLYKLNVIQFNTYMLFPVCDVLNYHIRNPVLLHDLTLGNQTETTVLFGAVSHFGQSAGLLFIVATAAVCSLFIYIDNIVAGSHWKPGIEECLLRLSDNP